MERTCVVAAALLLIIGTSAQEAQQQPQQQQTFRDVDDLCLMCICQASSGCVKKGCLEMDGNKFCGSYQISKGYWIDAGKPVVKGGSAASPTVFEDCATDQECSATAVRQYLLKYVRNCNQDTLLDCEDIARLHKAGPFACDKPELESTAYWSEFSKCYF